MVHSENRGSHECVRNDLLWACTHHWEHVSAGGIHVLVSRLRVDVRVPSEGANSRM
jgi:hypothetical protein